MNILDIIILSILGISLISGMYKGFLTSGLAIVGFAAAWIGAMSFYPQVSAALQENQSLMDMFRYYLDPNTFFTGTGIDEKIAAAVSRSELASILEGLKLPESLKQLFSANVLSHAFESLHLETLGDYLGQTICGAGVNVISFLIMFIVSYIVMLLVVKLLDKVFRFPTLKSLDWLLGGVFGLIRGAVITVLIFSILPLLINVLPVEVIGDLLEESKLYGIFRNEALLQQLIHSVL